MVLLMVLIMVNAGSEIVFSGHKEYEDELRRKFPRRKTPIGPVGPCL